MELKLQWFSGVFTRGDLGDVSTGSTPPPPEPFLFIRDICHSGPNIQNSFGHIIPKIKMHCIGFNSLQCCIDVL